MILVVPILFQAFKDHCKRRRRGFPASVHQMV